MTDAKTSEPGMLPDGNDGSEGRAPLGRTYWLCNVIEMWERLAYFVLRPIAPIYIAQATEPGGLHLTQFHKGWIYMWWALFQSFLPMFTGGYADRYGYKKTLFFAVTMNICGYLTMAYVHSYAGFFTGIILLAIGTAFFKPSLQGTLAHQLTKENSSLGWGVFYWVVNVGSLIGHYLSPLMLGNPHSAAGWKTVFLACAGFTAMNYIMLFTFKDVSSGASKTESPAEVLARTLKNVVEPRLLTWLLIMSCFWLMMYQLWDLQPNFIEDWVDSSMVAAHMPFESWRETGDLGLVRVPQQVLISLNALLIVLLMVPVSWAVRKFRALTAMFFGMMVATSGVLLAGLTGNGWFLLLGIFMFSMGEMLTGPKKNQYLAMIAPPGKKGLYLGYVNIPVGVGVGLGSWIAGQVYGAYGEKATLALDHLGREKLVAQAVQGVDWSDSLELVADAMEVDRGSAVEILAEQLGEDRGQVEDLLRDRYQYDRGQIVNLSLQWLAMQPDRKADARRRLVELLRELPDDAEATAAADRLSGDAASLEDVDVARWVHLLPDALGVKRTEALAVACLVANEGNGDGEQLGQVEVIRRWRSRFSDDPGTLNNLALEYLAQGTDHLKAAVETMDFADPLTQIEERLGIGRTKAFSALSIALGADGDAVDEALRSVRMASNNLDERASVYLINMPQHRAAAVASKDWTKDVQLLERLIAPDEQAMAVVQEGIDELSGIERLVGAVGGLFGTGTAEDRSTWDRLAIKQGLIKKSLAKKDWTRSSEDAAYLLGLSPFETRALVAAELTEAPVVATRLLWDKYNPQYKVWLPFAAIGILAAIALAIFGRMAKRWSDMNA